MLKYILVQMRFNIFRDQYNMKSNYIIKPSNIIQKETYFKLTVQLKDSKELIVCFYNILLIENLKNMDWREI